MARSLTRAEQQTEAYRKLQESLAMMALRSANQHIANAHAATKDDELVAVLEQSKAVLRRLNARNRDDKFTRPQENANVAKHAS